MLHHAMKVSVLGLMALLVVGALAATPAFAVEEGPYCHHRVKGSGEDEGRITEASPEEVFGTGSEQTFSFKIAETKSVINIESVQVKGIIYNNADQCQAKLELKYHNLTMTGKGCTPVFNGNNSVNVFAHRAWKYSGNPEELKKGLRQQKLDWIVTPKDLEQGSTVTELPNGVIATMTFIKHAGEACAVESIKLPVEGTWALESNPSALEEWRALETQTIKTIGLQQYWNGINWIEFKTGLKLGNVSNPGTYIGKFSIEPAGKLKGKTPPQEIAYFEN